MAFFLVRPVEDDRHDVTISLHEQRLHRARLPTPGDRRPARRYPHAVGFNPFRPQQRRRSDYVMVVVAFAVIAVILLWALIPR